MNFLKFRFTNKGSNCTAAAWAIFFDNSEVFNYPENDSMKGHTFMDEQKMIQICLPDSELRTMAFNFKGLKKADFSTIKKVLGLSCRGPHGMICFSVAIKSKGALHSQIFLYSSKDDLFFIIDSNLEKIVCLSPNDVFLQLKEMQTQMISMSVLCKAQTSHLYLFHSDDLPHLFQYDA